MPVPTPFDRKREPHQHLWQQPSPFCRDAHALDTPLKQRKAQLLFCMIQHAADIGLRYVEQARGCADAGGLYDGLKDFYVTEPHHYLPCVDSATRRPL